MRWWNPFGAAVFAFSGAPAAGFDDAVVLGAGEGEVVEVGLAVVGPIAYRVMDLAVDPGHWCSRGVYSRDPWNDCLGDAPLTAAWSGR
jgi:hypothetical protein